MVEVDEITPKNTISAACLTAAAITITTTTSYPALQPL